MASTLRYASQARKDLERLDAETLRRILVALEELRANPQKGGTLRGKKVGRRKFRVATTGSATISSARSLTCTGCATGGRCTGTKHPRVHPG